MIIYISAIVGKAAEVVQQNPDILPRSFDIEEMKRDVELFEAIYPIWQAMTWLCELIDDTKMAVGSEAYVAALPVYNYAKNSPIATLQIFRYAFRNLKSKI